MKYQHDCDKCKAIESITFKGTDYDIYECGDSIIARYGNDGPEYASAPKSCIVMMDSDETVLGFCRNEYQSYMKEEQAEYDIKKALEKLSWAMFDLSKANKEHEIFKSEKDWDLYKVIDEIKEML